MVVEYWGCKDANDDLASRQSTSDKLECLRTELKIWIFITPLGTVTIDQTNDVDLFGGVDNDNDMKYLRLLAWKWFSFSSYSLLRQLEMFSSGAAFSNTIVFCKERAYLTLSKYIQWKKRFPNTGHFLLTHACGQIRSNWTMTQFSGENDNGSVKDKSLMPKQANLYSRIKVSSWCTSHFMTRPPLASPSLFFPTFTRLLKSCGMWAGWRESGQYGKHRLNHFHPQNLYLNHIHHDLTQSHKKRKLSG